MSEQVIGVDYSSYNDSADIPGIIDYAMAKRNGAEFMIFRASLGSTRHDRVWDDGLSVPAAIKTGAVIGAYHFLDDSNWRTQLDLFKSQLKKYPVHLPPIVDFEYKPPNGDGTLWEFTKHLMDETGRTPIMYTGYYYWLENVKYPNSPTWAQFPLWLAQYKEQANPHAVPPFSIISIPPPWKKFHFLQFDQSGDGVKYGSAAQGSLGADVNVWNGTLNELRTFAGMDKVPDITDRVAALEKAAKAHGWIL